ncbi:hypothetical protein COT99_01930 [Candidatus Falkowbacteria bacterium CG10_big_fil_rev_8_21_14_0_10_43_10]|uniref:Septum formation initiator n=1 Tax=Candidatus Falkowbacteria bacterium CG10_big_fil_rev_8_21_14_0_10_43_10 TaxID=1974567 RepID=A0A2H0V2B5_9BACT|nr:MAG: hypothetical protein COT99_01930 [Candidatus Falkowbacteria bacterium CG10_big_fil_rev_8_21_14_0_10_43_10]
MRIRFAKKESFLRRSILSSKFFSALALFIIILIAFPLVKKINQQRILNREIKELEEEVARVDNKNEDLRELIDYLNSDSFAEKEARVNLDMRKPGEKVVIFKDDGASDANKSEVETVFNIPGLDKGAEQVKKTNSQKWRAYFFEAADISANN